MISSACAFSSGVKSIRSLSVDALPIERRRPGRERLRRRQFLARNIRRRNRPLLDRPDRLAGHAIEHVQESLLARLRDRLDAAAVDGDVEQRRRAREVVVPHAVMHRLEVPDALSGFDVDGDEALGEQVVALAEPAPVVAVRRRQRQIDVTELVVAAHHRPDVDVAGVAVGMILPGVGAELAVARHGVKRPLELAGARRRTPRRSLAPIP